MSSSFWSLAVATATISETLPDETGDGDPADDGRGDGAARPGRRGGGVIVA
jgi:hypothetical protein